LGPTILMVIRWRLLPPASLVAVSCSGATVIAKGHSPSLFRGQGIVSAGCVPTVLLVALYSRKRARGTLLATPLGTG
jgi:hypothetical protein